MSGKGVGVMATYKTFFDTMMTGTVAVSLSRNGEVIDTTFVCLSFIDRIIGVTLERKIMKALEKHRKIVTRMITREKELGEYAAPVRRV